MKTQKPFLTLVLLALLFLGASVVDAQITPNDPNHTPGVTGTVRPGGGNAASEENAGTVLGGIFEVLREPIDTEGVPIPGNNANPPATWIPGNTNNAGNTKTGHPDLKINGQYGDVYKPTTPTQQNPVNTATIIGKIKLKGTKQGTVIVVDLFDHTPADAGTVTTEIDNKMKKPKGGLKEVDVIIVLPPDGSVQQLYPPKAGGGPVILLPPGTNTNGQGGAQGGGNNPPAGGNNPPAGGNNAPPAGGNNTPAGQGG